MIDIGAARADGDKRRLNLATQLTSITPWTANEWLYQIHLANSGGRPQPFP